MFDANNISARGYVRHVSGFDVCRLASKLSQRHPDTKYSQKRKYHTL